MGLKYENLDKLTRDLMVQEINRDAATDGLYMSNYLNADGQLMWKDVLIYAVKNGDDETLAGDLNGLFKETVERSNGVVAKVPVTAPQTLAQGQFNMYYMRALSMRSIMENMQMEVYRGRESANPRPESEALVGKFIDPNEVLDTLRLTKGIVPAEGIQIPMPNSGITLRLVA